jgi:hypothetical protein
MKVIGSAFAEFVPNEFLKNIKDVNLFRKGIGGSGAYMPLQKRDWKQKPLL